MIPVTMVALGVDSSIDLCIWCLELIYLLPFTRKTSCFSNSKDFKGLQIVGANKELPEALYRSGRAF